jgi:hypothetical protein
MQPTLAQQGVFRTATDRQKAVTSSAGFARCHFRLQGLRAKRKSFWHDLQKASPQRRETSPCSYVTRNSLTFFVKQIQSLPLLGRYPRFCILALIDDHRHGRQSFSEGLLAFQRWVRSDVSGEARQVPPRIRIIHDQRRQL